MAHEGGYSSMYAPFCALAVVEELAGTRSDAEDPYIEEFSRIGQQELQPHQKAAVDSCIATWQNSRKVCNVAFRVMATLPCLRLRLQRACSSIGLFSCGRLRS